VSSLGTFISNELIFLDFLELWKDYTLIDGGIKTTIRDYKIIFLSIENIKVILLNSRNFIKRHNYFLEMFYIMNPISLNSKEVI